MEKDSNQRVFKNAENPDNTLGILTHLLGIFTWFLGPLVIFLASDDEKTKKHSKFALNWQFSALIYSTVGVMLSMAFIVGEKFILHGFNLFMVYIGFIVLGAVGILNTIFCIIATVKASEGKYWKYPLAIPFFKVKK